MQPGQPLVADQLGRIPPRTPSRRDRQELETARSGSGGPVLAANTARQAVLAAPYRWIFLRCYANPGLEAYRRAAERRRGLERAAGTARSGVLRACGPAPVDSWCPQVRSARLRINVALWTLCELRGRNGAPGRRGSDRRADAHGTSGFRGVEAVGSAVAGQLNVLPDGMACLRLYSNGDTHRRHARDIREAYGYHQSARCPWCATTTRP
jgi:hypothetical protein